ncbi:fungal-specific transcription factor domain-containing protein [Lindgomyces ingoldianus]|uniref:Fungal-specific transcription factor domain-containing protein n=1 Tax=Lindgomyces ingoldianus TaxID=673940 RepID=A0ACB6Q9N5_9PLEO|nr:fungal-specific transcription factor domain-containing protein [Lindgomyces ingoldianus]KAF2463739.1 fungal-specific transcription factor domain-containing protein [Lindgomyces ingoldianus]
MYDMPEQVVQSRIVRRRNPRPINSCVECRTRKSRCSKTHPCQNCTAFGRECVFITVPESAARRKNRESSKSNADWTQPLPVRTQTTQPENSSTNAITTTPGTPPRDYEWEAYQQHVDIDGDAWEKLPAEPEETHDDVYEDENEDEDQIATDLTIRIGRMIICENITGFFRPQYAEELGKLLSEHPALTSSVAGQRAPQSSALLSAENMPSLSPSLNLLLGASAHLPQGSDLESLQLPTRLEAEALFLRYVESVSPLAHVLHIPSFKRVFERFWMNIEIGNPNQNSCTALILSICMAAAATLSPLQAKAQFSITKEDLFLRLQKATERALLRANWSKTSNIRTLQALTIYLIPLCRAQISRATSVVVGALVRLAQCIGIHRISHNSANSLTPFQRHVRSLLWYQICFLDFKTAEAQGPHPSIRSDDFDIPLPLNVDDDVFELGTTQWQPHPTPIQGWTDVTLSLIRYECNELHRLIFRGRIEMDRKAITLHDLRARVEAQKRQIHAKYLHFLDAHVPIQRYAGLVATLLMARCDSMLLYRHLPQTSIQPRSESENRLRDVLLTAALTTLEIGATLDTLPSLSSWAWYSTTYQQYHAVLLLLTELYRTPDLPRKDRMVTIIDHVFGHCYGISVRERCSDLLWTVKENLEAFYIMKGIRSYKSMVTTPTPPYFPSSQPLSQSQSQSQSQGQTLQSLTQHQPQQSQQPGTGTTTGTSATPDFASMTLQSQLANPMDSLNVDLDTLLNNLGSAGSSAPEGFEDFLSTMQTSDPSAIFVPVDNGGNGPGQGNEWMVNDGWGFQGGSQG